MDTIELERLQLGQSIGFGTVGTICEATDPVTGERYAVKILNPAVSRNDLIRERFKREMSILERLKHPNIISYYGGGEHDGQLYYIMELVEGGSIKQLFRNGQHLSWQEVASVTIQLCSALQCAHNHGVIHRDIKPANIFLTADGVVKLGDFGIARDINTSELTGDGMTVGTHAYMAPEQITLKQTVTGKVDLYALGCCLYEMLTGVKAFQGESIVDLFESHLKAAPPRVRDRIPDCPNKFDEIIAKLLEKDPEARPFNARQVQGVMMEIASEHGVDRSLPIGGTDHGKPTKDVGAETAIGIGQDRLKDRIQREIAGIEAPNVSWKVIVGVIVFVVVVVTLLSLFPS